jgi:tRNA threonylcarbamoyl adenosine modification protein YeaZ
VLLLAFDTATPAVTVALHDGQRVLAETATVDARRHGELLAPSIAKVIADAGADQRDLTAIAVGVGPGPFTGLRVGIMTAAAMGDALGIPVYGECSLDVIATCLRSGEQAFAVLTDARRKQVYWAPYDAAGCRIEGPDIATPADLAGRVTRLAGAGALAYREHFGGFRIVEESAYPEASALARLLAAKVRSASAGDDLTPLYLRRPDATPPGRPKQVTPA